MSKPPASGPEGDAGPDPKDKADTQAKNERDKEQAMEEAQEEAAEDRATEGGYQ
jgi:hypothetical protein